MTSSSTTRIEIEPRPNDYDVLGHVNHAIVLEYLESARKQWFRGHGFLPNQVAPVVVKVEIAYNRELVDGPFHVETTVAGLEDAVYKLYFQQQVLPASGGAPAVSARVECAFIDLPSRTLRSFEDFATLARAARPS